MINMMMTCHFHGDEMVYHSFDHAVDDPHNYYPKEFLNTDTQWSTSTCVEAEDWLSGHIA